MYGVIGQYPGIGKHDRANRGVAPPVGQALAGRTRGTQRIKRGRPARISSGTLVQRRHLPCRPARHVGGWLERRCAKQRKRARERLAERRIIEPDPLPRFLEQCLTASDLLLQVVGARTRTFQFVCDRLPPVGFEIGAFERSGHRRGIAVANASLSEALLNVIVDDLGKAAQFALDRLGFAHEDFEHPVFRTLRQHKVVAAHLRGRLQLAIDAPVALLDAARVPR